jgi:hypothetical protein
LAQNLSLLTETKIVYLKNQMSMKLISRIALTAAVVLSAFGTITYTSCNKDECKDVVCANGGTCNSEDGSCSCATGFSGTTCQVEVRDTYENKYKGNGSDNNGGSYTNWSLMFAPTTEEPLAMSMTLLDENNAAQLNFTVHLTSNTAFTVDEKTTALYKYTGSGTINESTATLTLTEVTLLGSTTTVYTFNNMNKI